MISFNNIEITEPIGLNGSFSLYYHRLNILMGKSGCGKTTLLYWLNQKNRTTYNGNMSFMFQDVVLVENDSLYTHLKTLSDLFDLNLTILQMEQWLKKVDLPFILDTLVGELSIGQQQRFSFILCLLKPHQLLILDEPTSAQDDSHTQMMVDILKNHCHDHYVLVATHDQRFLLEITSLITIEEGNINCEKRSQKSRKCDVIITPKIKKAWLFDLLIRQSGKLFKFVIMLVVILGGLKYYQQQTKHYYQKDLFKKSFSLSSMLLSRQSTSDIKLCDSILKVYPYDSQSIEQLYYDDQVLNTHITLKPYYPEQYDYAINRIYLSPRFKELSIQNTIEINEVVYSQFDYVNTTSTYREFVVYMPYELFQEPKMSGVFIDVRDYKKVFEESGNEFLLVNKSYFKDLNDDLVSLKNIFSSLYLIIQLCLSCLIGYLIYLYYQSRFDYWFYLRILGFNFNQFLKVMLGQIGMLLMLLMIIIRFGFPYLMSFLILIFNLMIVLKLGLKWFKLPIYSILRKS